MSGLMIMQKYFILFDRGRVGKGTRFKFFLSRPSSSGIRLLIRLTVLACTNAFSCFPSN